MQTANTIISHIRSLPQFKVLKKHYCYNRFLSSLSPKYQKAIAFVYVRDRTLFIALSHPGYKMELNYKRVFFRDILNTLTEIDKKCVALKVDKVVIFNSKFISILKDKKPTPTVPYYREKSSATFQIKSSDQEIVQSFEKIRKSIKRLI